MPVFYSNARPAVLTNGQRTSLVNLIQAIFPGTVLATINEAHFKRNPDNTVTLILRERAQASVLDDLPDGALIEKT